MQIQKRACDNWTIVDLSGGIGNLNESIAFRKLLEGVLADGAKFVAINFENAEVLSSDFISSILVTHHSLKRSGGEMVLIGSNLGITETLGIIGIPMIMSVFENEKSFREARPA